MHILEVDGRCQRCQLPYVILPTTPSPWLDRRTTKWGTTSAAQDHASTPAAAGKSPAIDTKNHAKTCWLLSKDLDGPIIAGSSTKIEAKLVSTVAKPQTPFLVWDSNSPSALAKTIS
ncbi:hypothetical protein CSOJ01_02761 [Colletotrichum sojae]|uniref:Uncharacterized protein n=1 Tax=Colletotrichum sojae TaxID=2175907 RepID=A0A8H6N2A6_9PEZI|nr:hypothetical protein CSOJ01_02761 [Colletotrichum sojae]